MRLIRAAAAAALLAAVSVGTAAPAAASGTAPGGGIDVCGSREAPYPELPSVGIARSQVPVPDNPPTGDPFAPDGPPISEVYGLAGASWDTYDLGCAQGVRVDDNLTEAMTLGANVGQDAIADTMIAAVGMVSAWAYNPGWLSILDGPVEVVAGGLYDGLFLGLVGLAATVGAIAIILAARRGQVPGAVAAGGLALLALAAAAIAATNPERVTRVADAFIPAVAVAASQEISGNPNADPSAAAIAPFVDVQYDRWLDGMFGCSQCPAAEEYGPALFDASAMTYAEQARYLDDPTGDGEAIIEAKREAYEDAMAGLADDYPLTYAHAQGKESLNRLASGAATPLLLAIPAGFLLVALALIPAAMLIWRIVWMLAPAWALLGLIPATQGVLPRLGRTLAAALVNAIAFAVIAATQVAMFTALISDDAAVNPWLGIVLAIGLTLLLWFFAAPFRRLTSLARTDPLGAASETWGATRSRARHVGSAIVGSFVGNKAANHFDDDHDLTSEPGEDRQRNAPDGGPRYARPVQDRTHDDAIREGYYRAPAPRSGGHDPSPQPAWATPPPEAERGPSARPVAALPPGDGEPGVQTTAPTVARVNLDAPQVSAPRRMVGITAAEADARPDAPTTTPQHRETPVRADANESAVFTRAPSVEGRVMEPGEPLPPTITVADEWTVYDPGTGEYRPGGEPKPEPSYRYIDERTATSVAGHMTENFAPHKVRKDGGYWNVERTDPDQRPESRR